MIRIFILFINFKIMKTEKEIKKVERKKGRVNGQITQIMTSFRVDADVVDYLKSKPNRGRFLNELIRIDK